MPSIYDPAVKAHAELFGISELQAYRNLNARDAFLNRQRNERVYGKDNGVSPQQ